MFCWCHFLLDVFTFSHIYVSKFTFTTSLSLQIQSPSAVAVSHLHSWPLLLPHHWCPVQRIAQHSSLLHSFIALSSLLGDSLFEVRCHMAVSLGDKETTNHMPFCLCTDRIWNAQGTVANRFWKKWHNYLTHICYSCECFWTEKLEAKLVLHTGSHG